jgi:uncharacterized protein (DUF488 family)
MTGPEVLTIGHSTHTIEEYCALLLTHDVTAVADVRSAPYSRYQPDFNREHLHESLMDRGIAYVFLGRELGARPNDASLYEDGRVQFGRLAETELFRAGLDRVLQGAQRYRLALMCAEKEPLDCHRTLLVGRELEARGVKISHIHADGHIETSDAAMSRLLALRKLPEEDLFRQRDEMVAAACLLQAKRIAYVDREMRAASLEALT